MKRFAAWCLLLALAGFVSGCSRVSTLYVHNNSSRDVRIVVKLGERQGTYTIPAGEWQGTLREYKPDRWEFEFTGLYDEPKVGAIDHNSSSNDAFIEIDDDGWHSRGMPAWYFFERKLAPLVPVLVLAGIVWFAIYITRRENARLATAKTPDQ